MRPDQLARSPSITTVVFDLGGVLIDWDPRHLYRQMFSDPEEMEIFLRDVVSPDWNAEQDSGRTWAEATALLLEQHPEQEPMITAYVERLDGDMAKFKSELPEEGSQPPPPPPPLLAAADCPPLRSRFHSDSAAFATAHVAVC